MPLTPTAERLAYASFMQKFISLWLSYSPLIRLSYVCVPVAVHQLELLLFTSPSCLYLLTVSGNQGNWSQSLLWCQEWNTCCVRVCACGSWTHTHTHKPFATLLLPHLMWCQSHGFQTSSSVNQNQTFIFNCFKSSTWSLWLAELIEVPEHYLFVSPKLCDYLGTTSSRPHKATVISVDITV